MDIIQKTFKKKTIDGTLLPLFYARDKDDFGIGDINSLYKAVDLKALLGQNIIEILPLNFSSAFESPYSVLSSRCLNTIYISISHILKKFPSPKAREFIKTHKSKILKLRNTRKVHYQEVRNLKKEIFTLIYEYFNKKLFLIEKRRFKKFMKTHHKWLNDHILFILLREKFMKDDPDYGWDFRTWPEEIRNRDPQKLKQLSKEYADELLFEKFLQWILWEQWQNLKRYALKKKVVFMGDIPYAVDGADIWMEPEIFGLKPPDFKRKFTQGVPPDMFSDSGQYWQFYYFDWNHPETNAFLLNRLKWNQQLFTIIRLDHVLGYYRSYMFYENPENQTSLLNLGIWDQVQDAIRRGHENPSRQGDIGWEIYKIFLQVLKNKNHLFQSSFVKDFYSGKKDYVLKENNMLLIAKKSEGDNPSPHSVRHYCVEKAVHFQKPFVDFIKISKENQYQDHDALCAYLFASGNKSPKPEDSLRPCFFKQGPGEKLMLQFQKQAKKDGNIIVTEALGIVPSFVTESLRTMKAINYIPMIYGMTPSDLNNPYFLPNHERDAFVTFALHDSETLVSFWNHKNISEKQLILDYLFGTGKEQAENHDKVNDKLQEAILSGIYKSKAKIKVLLWTDIFRSSEENAINKPGCQMGQWVSRMPKHACLDELIQALTRKQGSPLAVHAVCLLKKLKTYNADKFETYTKKKNHIM